MSSASSPGCVVLLVDESAGMGVVIKEMVTGGMKATKSNLQRVATSINALLSQLVLGPDFDVALVGYRTDAADAVDVGSRWGGALGGRDFVRLSELAGAALRTETRTRKIPAPDGMGVAREESVAFPVWYEPQLGSRAPQTAAFRFCHELLLRRVAESGSMAYAPLVVHITSGASDDGNPEMAVRKVQEMETPAGSPLVFHAHLASSAASVTIVYPSNYAFLTLGSSRDLFRRSSPLPEALAAALRQEGIPLNAGARGLLYNAKILDLSRLLGLVRTHTRDWVPPGLVEEDLTVEPEFTSTFPGAAEPLEPERVEASGEPAALVVLLLDRSLSDPYSVVLENAFARLQCHANDLLQQIARLETPQLEAAVVSYGMSPEGQVEIREGLEGSLAGRATLAGSELSAAAIRVEQVEERISDGAGGLITVKADKPVFVELEPLGAASPADGFGAAARVAQDWCHRHPGARVPPVVLHLTRGAFDPEQVREAAESLLADFVPTGGLLLYHLVVSESPHPSVAYPDDTVAIDEPALDALRRASSPLLGRERICLQRSTIRPDARGIVINGKFDLLLEGIQEALFEHPGS